MTHRRRSAGFTYVELMIVVAISAAMSAAVLAFYLQSLHGSNAAEQQIKLAGRMRAFMNELIFNGSRSHELILYKSADATDRTADGRLVVTNEDTEEVTDDICPTGDFAVFVYYELPKPADQGRYRISKLIGYYVDSSAASGPALTRITVDLSAAPSTDDVETILTANWSTAEREVIATRVTPLALSDTADEDSAPNLFYRRAGQSLAVCGQLLASQTGADTEDRRSYTRTFYFTVTVRT